MKENFHNINKDNWEESKDVKGMMWRFMDLSGDHLGVRIEKISPGGSSSYHHFHTLEEEHVIILEGAITLFLGDEECILSEGDHVWFAAGKEVAHHFENKTADVCKYLVFGERNKQDVVIYPEGQVMMIKALGNKQYTYRNFSAPKEPQDVV